MIDAPPPGAHEALLQLPAAMRERQQWLVWRFEKYEGDKKPRKVPYYVTGGKRQGKQGSEADRAADGHAGRHRHAPPRVAKAAGQHGPAPVALLAPRAGAPARRSRGWSRGGARRCVLAVQPSNRPTSSNLPRKVGRRVFHRRPSNPSNLGRPPACACVCVGAWGRPHAPGRTRAHTHA